MNLVQMPRLLSQKKDRSCCHGNPSASHPDAESQFTQRIRLLVHAACAARAGAAQMTLSDWRDVEQEVKQRLEYKKYEIKRSSKSVSRVGDDGCF